MDRKYRKSGIRAIGSLPWGSHICVFYSSDRNLSDILVPYFQAGLQNKECCLWLTSPSLDKEETVSAALKGAPGLRRYLANQEIEIVPFSSAYLEDGVINRQAVSYYLSAKLEQALGKGYEGLRVLGSTSWIKKQSLKDPRSGIDWLSNFIKKQNILLVCTFPLDKYGNSEMLDVVHHHQHAFIVEDGEWTSVDKATLRKIAEPRPVRQGALTPLQKRFAVSGINDFADHEIIELLFCFGPDSARQCDIDELIKRFGNIRGLITASPEEQAQAGLDEHCISFLQLMREIPARILADKIREQPVFKSPQDTFDYLYYSMRDLRREIFKVLYLDGRERIIEVDDLFKGSAGRISFDPRRVVENALDCKARSMIFVHNHPSGDPTPGTMDKQITRDLVFASNMLWLRVLDHIIIGENRYFSFAEEGLIKEYETDFLNLKITGTTEARRRLSRARQAARRQDYKY